VNGTFFTSNSYVPHFGYDESNELADDDIRARNGLKPKPRMKSIGDPTVRNNNYITHYADFIAFDETACTSPDQIAIAPGYLQSDSLVGGRRCFHYVMDKPVLDFTTTLSARYVVDSEVHHGVTIAIYRIPAHAFAVPSMMRAAEDGLDYFGAHFSPYQFRQYRVIEYPQYQTFAQSFPNTVPFSEAIGFIYRNEPGDDKIDFAYFVTAHELAHQWWAHQVVGGDGQGATMFSEGLAEYSALTIMEKRYGPEAAQKFLRRELDGYLQGRSVERKKEVPLLYVENQPYIHYRKGSLVFYALRDYIGEAAMNDALHAFVEQWQFKGPPYPTARDLFSELDRVTPDSLKYVLKDLFLDMTFYDNKADSATAARRTDGKYAVHLVLNAKKLKGDSLGNMTEVPINDYVDVGIFGAHIAGQKLGARLLVQKVHITQPVTTLDFVVDSLPTQAGIDPYNILIDRTPEDNVTRVKVAAAAPAKP
jgi:aminopeptidase N